MVRIKTGVKVNGIQSEMILGTIVASKVYEKYGYDFIITEVTGGKHGRGSLHYVGLAMDIRTRHISSEAEIGIIANEIRESLGKQYDVVVEKTHIHIEFQPK